eukprot:11206788-Lingulodinium_polyedra.AAC.1
MFLAASSTPPTGMCLPSWASPQATRMTASMGPTGRPLKQGRWGRAPAFFPCAVGLLAPATPAIWPLCL